MVAKSIVEIDVNDEKFQSFMEKFNEYQAALDEIPEAWRGAAHGIGESGKETAKLRTEIQVIVQAFSDGSEAILAMNSGLDRLNDNIDKANKNQSTFTRNTKKSQGFLSKASKDAKSLAGHIKDATTSLLSWGSIVGLFTGVIGVGGMFGMNRLAASASSQRFSAMGIGTSIGSLGASAINYQKVLGNPTGTLGAIRDTQMDLSKRWQFQAMGINNPDKDPAKLLPEMIRNARDIFIKGGSTLQGAQAHGLTNFFSLDDLNRFKNMSDEEISAMEKRAKQDSISLQISDKQARQWQEFNIQLDRSGQSIEKTFIRGLGPLTPSLSKLSDAMTGAIDTVLKSPELGKWIEGLSTGIQKFATYLASPEFTTDVEDFMGGLKRLGVALGRVVDLITGKISASEFFAGASPMLSNETVKNTDGGPNYVPGSESDPNVSPILKGLKLASGVAPVQFDKYFDEAAKKYGVDAKWLKATAAAESSWNQNAVGPKTKYGRAQGLMQVLPSNFLPGESPFDPRDNIMAGARVMKWAKGMAGGDLDETLRYYNGGVSRGSKENIEYPSRVREQYASMYGSSPQSASIPDNGDAGQSKSAAITNQLLQQLVDKGSSGGNSGLTVYNNTGGNAIVSSAQLGG